MAKDKEGHGSDAHAAHKAAHGPSYELGHDVIQLSNGFRSVPRWGSPKDFKTEKEAAAHFHKFKTPGPKND